MVVRLYRPAARNCTKRYVVSMLKAVYPLMLTGDPNAAPSHSAKVVFSDACTCASCSSVRNVMAASPIFSVTSVGATRRHTRFPMKQASVTGPHGHSSRSVGPQTAHRLHTRSRDDVQADLTHDSAGWWWGCDVVLGLWLEESERESARERDSEGGRERKCVRERGADWGLTLGFLG